MKRYVPILFLMMMGNVLKAQDFAFSQFYEKPLLRNPALAGLFEGDVRVSGIFRNQWQSVTVPYRTGAASVEMKLPFLKTYYLTLGLQTTYDEAGDIRLKRTAILPMINLHVPLDQYGTYLQGGLMLGAVRNQFDPTKAKYGDQWVNGSYNPANPTAQQFNRTGMNYFDASAGMVLNGNRDESFHYYFGFGIYHWNRPSVAFYTNNDKTSRLETKWTVTTGVKMETSDNNTLELFADYYTQSGHHQFIGGALYGVILKEVTDEENNKIAVYAGALYRYDDAFIPVIRMDAYRMSMGLSYDVNVSKLATASQFRGGFELSLSYRMKFNNGFNSSYSRQVDCPPPGKGF